MDDTETDPEVLADLQLRDSSERDPTRRRMVTTWQHPTLVAQWKCRGKCGAMVDVQQSDVDHADFFDGLLAKRDEKPLDRDAIVFCEACRKKGFAQKGDANRRKVDKMAALIRELRGGATFPAPPGPAPRPEREREIVRDLISLGHPDIDGLTRAVRESRNRRPSNSRT